MTTPALRAILPSPDYLRRSVEISILTLCMGINRYSNRGKVVALGIMMTGISTIGEISGVRYVNDFNWAFTSAMSTTPVPVTLSVSERWSIGLTLAELEKLGPAPVLTSVNEHYDMDQDTPVSSVKKEHRDIMIIDDAYMPDEDCSETSSKSCPGPPTRNIFTRPTSSKAIPAVPSSPATSPTVPVSHSVTVYERSDRVGGLLMYGIPNMKLDKKAVQRRVDFLASEGVKFVTSVFVGQRRQPSLESLRADDAPRQDDWPYGSKARSCRVLDCALMGPGMSMTVSLSSLFVRTFYSPSFTALVLTDVLPLEVQLCRLTE
ncbi:hypothetical protein BU16DRAFT_554168 [Lophium mytilinum]|uniref:Uncharacterized protein n=1 Tax=Lophium mytilinum TaxID=390894 RepID=A0A6A6RBJ9_9PEZI|nr:hypothetical protein BU16DRAFT_554168 [Lophium mytilinum]